jgi:thiamine pyrophosphate-dependent acetolactate synthase large subunit-like protein
MADGYARATGHPGVALVISGPGLTNALTALGEARHDAVPLVLISSDIPRRYRNGPHGYLHQLESPTTMTASVTKERIRVENASEIEPALRYLFGVATAGRPGPVHLEIPIDVLQEPVVPEVPVETVVSLAESAHRPWIVAGGGAVGAAREVRELAAKLDALVVTTAAGKGVLPEEDARSVGGRLHTPAVRAELEASDLVFVVGSQLSSTDLWVDRLAFSGTVVNINIDGAHLTAGVEPDVAIRGDAATVLRELTAALPEGTARTRGERRTGTETLRERAVSELPGVLGLPEATVVRMRTVLAQIAEGFSGPIDAVFGNNDGDPYLLTTIAAQHRHVTLHGQLAELEVAGLKIALNHYPDISRSLAQSGQYDAVFSGHDHKAYTETFDSCLWANPGEVMGRFGSPSWGLFETDSRSFSHRAIPHNAA